MNSHDDENKTNLVFKSTRFDPLLAEDLSDYVHEKKKIVKTSIDAEVQRAAARKGGQSPSNSRPNGDSTSLFAVSL